MNDTTAFATVGEAIAALSAHDPTTPPRIATQPDYPLEHLLARVMCTPEDTEGDGTPPTDPPMMQLGTGEQVGHLPACAADALGWSR
ncbi:hypothetical protein ACFV4N_15465 [Actinosynnema sp. NPDC059797]